MGGSESALSAIEGYQVARVLESSPAHHCGLVPFFDFIVAVDGLQLEREHKMQFQQYVTKNVNKTILLSVFNLRSRVLREVQVTPSDAWGGVGVLGCSLNWETAERAVENSWHIVDVAPDTPSAGADLIAQRDYLIGMQPPDEETITMFADSNDFQDRISRWKSLRGSNSRTARDAILLMVFDSVSNSIKEIDVPMHGQLTLGIDVANGYLHVVPQMPESVKLPFVAQFHSPSVPKPAPVARDSSPPAPVAPQYTPAALIPPPQQQTVQPIAEPPVHQPATRPSPAAPPPPPPTAAVPPPKIAEPPARTMPPNFPQQPFPNQQPYPQQQPAAAAAKPQSQQPVPQPLQFPAPMQFPTFPAFQAPAK